jgi:hypothetical protein
MSSIPVASELPIKFPSDVRSMCVVVFAVEESPETAPP